MRSIPKRMAFALAATVMASCTSVTAAVVTVATAPAAQALCATNPMSGLWKNINLNTRSITQAELNIGCSDQVFCAVDEASGTTTCSPSVAYSTIRVWGSCSPTDCDWGTKQMVLNTANGSFSAKYSYSWATKNLWINTWTNGGVRYMEIQTQVDFTAADGRTDYITVDTFMHV